MPLTPEDVRNKRFTPVRLREGYDMGEVDQFLDEVETELERLHHENDDLRQKLAAAQRGEDAGYAPAPAPVPEPEPVREEPAPQPPAPAPAPAPASTPAPASAGSAGEASASATRLLEIATQNADQLVSEAKEQANRIIAEARAKGERTENEARGLAARLESEARQKSEALERETEQRRSQLFGQLEKDKQRLEQELEHLRGFERQYRSRLKAYFEGQLRALAGQNTVESEALQAEESGSGGGGAAPSGGSGGGGGNSYGNRGLAPASYKQAEAPAGMDRQNNHRNDRGAATPRLNALLEEDDESAL